MTTLKTPPPDVLEYLQAVRATLADLPPEERDELMVDVETALLEAAEESERPLASRLGPPEEFAADLRAAAGLQDRPSPAPAVSGLRELLVAALQHPRIDAARRVATDLAPIWWVARAFVAYAVIALALQARTSIKHPWMPVVSDSSITFVVLALFVAASLWLGLRHRQARAVLWLDVVLALVALPLAANLASHSSAYSRGDAAAAVVYEPPVERVAFDGRMIRNIYPYTRDGRLLHDVLLFDDLGNPLKIGDQASDPNRRVLTTRAGKLVFNSFPINYFEPGTRRVADPDATATPITVAPIRDPAPLRPTKRP